VTGRTTASKPGTTPGTISEVADSITRAGGVGIAIVCDHADDAQIKALFERLKAEHGHLDIPVNNAMALGPDPYAPPPFWNKSRTISEQFTAGLRSAFVASYYAAPLLIAADRALVENVSYCGAVSYQLDPAYGATKAGLDKLTVDLAQDFKPYRVAVVSIWPGRQPPREPSPSSRKYLEMSGY
jgi:NAD(P)-dependent dehydrogenase (short-subunit alcohol dehydrogenase family)